MADQARVGSLEDLERFRAQLVTLLVNVRASVEEAGMEVVRQKAWIEIDRRKHWEGELGRRQRKLEAARQSLFQESIANQRGPSSFLQMQVHRAEQRVAEAHAKLVAVKTWSRNFEHRSLPMVKQIEQLHSVLAVEMVRAVNFLNQTIVSMEAYADRRPQSPPSPSGNSSFSSSGSEEIAASDTSSLQPSSRQPSSLQPSSLQPSSLQPPVTS